jgi:hypothetical protein
MGFLSDGGGAGQVAAVVGAHFAAFGSLVRYGHLGHGTLAELQRRE